MRAASRRLRWYSERDQNKMKTDVSRNNFESMIYKLRDWLRDEDNEQYVQESVREAEMENLSELEDWLYEDGASANYTVYDN
jgi:hypothetical protein